MIDNYLRNLIVFIVLEQPVVNLTSATLLPFTVLRLIRSSRPLRLVLRPSYSKTPLSLFSVLNRITRLVSLWFRKLPQDLFSVLTTLLKRRRRYIFVLLLLRTHIFPCSTLPAGSLEDQPQL